MRSVPGRFLKTRIVIFILVLAAGSLLYWSQNHLSPTVNAGNIESGKERDLYLPEPGYLRFISMGHDGLIADLVLAKALTYYGSHYRERDTFTFRHLEKLFITAVEMDPRNRDAILMAANILSNIDIQAALRMLKRGMRHHPQDWKFPEMTGYFYFFRLDDPYRAGKFYELASGMPGHPPYVPSLSGKFYRESGRYEEAMRVLHNFYSTTDDPRLKQSFKDSMDRLAECIKSGDFRLRATITSVIDWKTIRFAPDRVNPRFRFMKETETLNIKNLDIPDPKEPVNTFFTRIRNDFAVFALEGKPVRIGFVQDKNMRLKRNKNGGFYGSITLKNNRSYSEILKLSGLNDLETKFPPEPIDLDLNEIYHQVGRVVSVRFRVHGVAREGKSVVLNSASAYRNRFRVMIPAGAAHAVLPEDFDRVLPGRVMVVSGLALFKNRGVYVTVYSPRQLVTGGHY